MGGDSELQKDTVRKKRKKEKRSMTVNIELVKEQPDKIPPLVGYFPSAFDPNKSKKSRPDPPSVRVYRHSTRQNRLEIVVSPSKPSTVEFVGKTHDGEAAAHKMCSYALGVLDKETQKLRIVFRLDPVFKGLDVSDKTPSTPATIAENYDKIRELTNTYGTTKAKKGVQKAMQLRIKDDTTSQPELDKQLDDAIDKDALASTSAEATRSIPPHDLHATTPEASYPLDKIIFAGDWDYLLDIWELFQAEEEISPKSYSAFVCSRVHKLDLIKDESEQKKLACILSFINHLIKFKNKNSMDGFASAKTHRTPSIIFQRFSSMFIDSEKNRLSDEKIGLLISYVLVLTLYVDNFETIPADISKDLKMPTQDLKVHFENLGCKYVRRSNTSVATLPVPLQFRTLRRKRR
ncbi:hypothetical protein V2J09_004567 [Rumex salicifolius]